MSLHETRPQHPAGQVADRPAQTTVQNPSTYQCACGAVVAVNSQCQHCNMARYSQNQVAEMSQQLYTMQAQINQGTKEMTQLRFDLTYARTEQSKAGNMNNMLSRQNEEVSGQLVAQCRIADGCMANAADLQNTIKKLQLTNASLKTKTGLHIKQHAGKQGDGDSITLNALRDECAATKEQLALIMDRCRKLTSENETATRASAQEVQRAVNVAKKNAATVRSTHAARAKAEAEHAARAKAEAEHAARAKAEAVRCELQQALTVKEEHVARQQAEMSCFAEKNTALSQKIADLEKNLKKVSGHSHNSNSGQMKTKVMRKLQAEIAKSSDRERSLRNELGKCKSAAVAAKEELGRCKSAAEAAKKDFDKSKSAAATIIAELDKSNLDSAKEAAEMCKNATEVRTLAKSVQKSHPKHTATLCQSKFQGGGGGGGGEGGLGTQVVSKKKKKKKKKITKGGVASGASGASGAQQYFGSTEKLLAETQECLRSRTMELEELRNARSSGSVSRLAEAAVDMMLDKAGVAQLLKTIKGLQHQHNCGLKRLVESEEKLAESTKILAHARMRLAEATSMFTSVEGKISKQQELYKADNGEENEVYTDILLDLASFITGGEGFEHDSYVVDEVASWKMFGESQKCAAEQNGMLMVHCLSSVEARIGRPHFEAGCTTPYQALQGVGRLLEGRHINLCMLGKSFLECCTKMYPALGAIMSTLHARIGDGTVASTTHWLAIGVTLLKKMCRELEVTEVHLNTPVIVQQTEKGACNAPDLAETIYQLHEINKSQHGELKRRGASLLNLEQTTKKLRARIAQGEGGGGEVVGLNTPNMPPATSTANITAVSLSRTVALVRSVFNNVGLGSEVFDSGFTENVTPELYSTWLFEKTREGLELLTGHCRNLMVKSDMASKTLVNMTTERNSAADEIASLRHVFEASGFTGESVNGLKKQIATFRTAHDLQKENDNLKKVNTCVLQRLKIVNAQLEVANQRFAVQSLRNLPTSDLGSPGLSVSPEPSLLVDGESNHGMLLPPLQNGGGRETDVFTVVEKLHAREEDLKRAKLKMARQAEQTDSLRTELATLQEDLKKAFRHSKHVQARALAEQVEAVTSWEAKIKLQTQRSTTAERTLLETQHRIDAALCDTNNVMEMRNPKFKSELEEAQQSLAAAQQERDMARMELLTEARKNAVIVAATCESEKKPAVVVTTHEEIEGDGKGDGKGERYVMTTPTRRRSDKTNPSTREKVKVVKGNETSPQSVVDVAESIASSWPGVAAMLRRAVVPP
jgi:hypothetical protein